MVRKRFDVEVPDGQHLGFSRDSAGAYRAHLFDDATNRLVGHAELIETDDDEDASHWSDWSDADLHGSRPPRPESRRHLTPEEVAETLEALAAVALVGASLASAAAPHVRRWWKGTAVAAREAGARGRSAARESGDGAVNALRSTWGKVARTRKADEAGAAEGATTDDSRPGSADPTELEAALRDHRARMSSAEAQERLVAALLARTFSDEQLRLLRSVVVDDDGDEPVPGDALGTPTAQQVGETVRLVLERNPSLLDGVSSAALADLLASGRQVPEPHPSRVRRPSDTMPGADSPA